MMETELSWLLRSGNEKDQGRLLKWTIPSLDPGVWGLELRNGWGPRGGDVANSRCMSSGPPVIRCWMDSGLLDVRRWQRRRSLWMARQEPAGRTTNWDAVLTEPLPAWPWTAEPRWHTDALVTLLCALSVWGPSGKSRPSPQMLWWILKALFLEAVSSLNSFKHLLCWREIWEAHLHGCRCDWVFINGIWEVMCATSRTDSETSSMDPPCFPLSLAWGKINMAI